MGTRHYLPVADNVRDFPRIAFRTPFEASQYLQERTTVASYSRQQSGRHSERRAVPSWSEYLPALACRS